MTATADPAPAPAGPRTLVSLWHGVYLLDGREVVRSVRPPLTEEALGERAELRAGGGRTPEEETVLAARGDEEWVTRDRRLVGPGVRFRSNATAIVPFDGDPGLQRSYLLRSAERRLEGAWDPSIHIEEAVRAVDDLDRARNLLGERLASWVGRDAPEAASEDADRAAREALRPDRPGTLGPADPRLAEARRRLAELYRAVGAAREELNAAIAGTIPARTPNLNLLLGPELAGRLLAQAGGLDRLARMPASTVQVLGAERAFFEHLRGRAPPPRHGLLFLHPQIQSAPRSDRGKLARALAGKVAIAARQDRVGAPAAPDLRAAFDRREAELRERRAQPRAGRRPGSRAPLDGAPRDR